MANMKKSKIALFPLAAVALFILGWTMGNRQNIPNLDLRNGQYVWDYDKMITGMDQELVIEGDSGFFRSMEPYLESTVFKIEDGKFVVTDTLALDYYLTEEGLGIIWAPNIHAIWRYEE